MCILCLQLTMDFVKTKFITTGFTFMVSQIYSTVIMKDIPVGLCTAPPPAVVRGVQTIGKGKSHLQQLARLTWLEKNKERVTSQQSVSSYTSASALPSVCVICNVILSNVTNLRRHLMNKHGYTLN